MTVRALRGRTRLFCIGLFAGLHKVVSGDYFSGTKSLYMIYPFRQSVPHCRSAYLVRESKTQLLSTAGSQTHTGG